MARSKLLRTNSERIITIGIILALVILLLSPTIKAAAVTEYSLWPGSLSPYGLTSDGTYIWFTEFGSDRIGRLDPTGSTPGDILEIQLPTGSRPYDIGYELGQSRIWFTESQRDKISFIDTGTYQWTEISISTNAGPRGIAIQENYHPGLARIWFTEFSESAIGLLTIGVPVYTEFYLPDSNSQPLSILYLNSTGVWFTEYNGHRIGFLNPVNKQLKEWPLKPGSFPWGIANDTFGNIWFTESGRNRIGKLNPFTNEITEYHIPSVNQPYGITVDRYNNIWFTDHGSNKIFRFDPASNVMVEFTRLVGGAPFDILWEDEGGKLIIYFSDETGNRIGRIDPTTAVTTLTAPIINTAITESSTATTLGTSTATSTTSTAAAVSGPAAVTSSTATTTSTTSYTLTESSTVLKTSSVQMISSVVTYTATTTATATSYVGTETVTTSVSATNIIPTSAQTTITTAKTATSYTATALATATSTTTAQTTITTTIFSSDNATGIAIPGYSNIAIISGLLVGVFMIMIYDLIKHSKGTLKLNPKYLRRFSITIIILILILACVPTTKAASITEWTLPPGSTIPYEITFDDSSPYRVWFTEFGSDRIGRLNTVTGEIFEVVLPSNSRPWGIAFEKARKELWFTMSGRNTVGIITNYGSGTVQELKMPAGLTGVDGPRGIAIQEYVNGTDYPYVWIAHYGGHSILKFDPYDKKLSAYWNLGATFNPQSIIFSKATGIWFTDLSANKRIGNLNPLTGQIKTWTIPTGGAPWDLIEDSKGYIWFTEDGSNRIGRLNPYSGEIIEFSLPSGSSQSYGITVDTQQNLWIADHAQNRVIRFSPDSNTFIEYKRPTGGAVWGMAFAQDSRIWFSDDATNKIGRIDTSLGLTTLTVGSFSTTSITTSTVSPLTASTGVAVTTTTASGVTTTLTTAPTTVSTLYIITETVKLLQTSTTATATVFSNQTITVLGIFTSYIPTTIATVTSTSTNYLTQTATSTITTKGIFTHTSYMITTLYSTFTTEVTTGFFPMIPGYSNPAILLGIALGLFTLFILKRRTQKTN
ncbi:Vgb family protein [[Eubacterium] cellulosolvens]